MEITVTVKEIIDNIRKNGLKHITHSFFEYNDISMPANTYYNHRREDIVGGCAIGQAAYNLKASGIMLSDSLDSLNGGNFPKIKGQFNMTFWDDGRQRLGNRIIFLNDEEKKSLDEICDTVEKEYSDLLDMPVTLWAYEN